MIGCVSHKYSQNIFSFIRIFDDENPESKRTIKTNNKVIVLIDNILSQFSKIYIWLLNIWNEEKFLSMQKFLIYIFKNNKSLIAIIYAINSMTRLSKLFDSSFSSISCFLIQRISVFKPLIRQNCLIIDTSHTIRSELH